MVFRWVVALCFLTSWAGAARAQGDQVSAGEDAPPVINTRQSGFSVPFQLGKATGVADQPTEVQLHISTDRGATWQISSRVSPDRGNFVFRAPHDGEYWFAVRTLDRSGRARPAGPLKPEMKVLVDTMPPRLDFTASRGPGGEIQAQWRVVDPNLKPDSLRIEYQSSTNHPWESLAVDPHRAITAEHTLSGEGAWWPQGNTGPLIVRAQVTDLAGNSAVQQAQLPAADRDKVAAHQASLNETSRSAARENAWPPDRSSDQTLNLSTKAGPRVGTSEEPWRAQKGRQSAAAASTNGPIEPPGDHRIAAQSISRQTADESRTGESRGAFDPSMLPVGERPRMVNSLTFELEYEIESVGSGGITKVELWGTRDAGRTWSSFGVDTDNRSPVRVKVPGEGVYGFRVVVQNGRGLGARPPIAGDPAELWIGVDLTKPTGKITAAEVGREAGEVSIRWEARDEMPDSRPVALFYGELAGGPWTPIATELENSGSYVWRIDSQVPDQVYLRLEVRDAAGNMAEFIPADAVNLERQRPQGHLRNVRPVNPSARGPKSYQFY